VRASKVPGPKKGKETHTREDDILEPTPDMLFHIQQLKHHLICEEHSEPGKKAYCVIKQSTENATGGHEEVTPAELSLWGKYMVSNVSSSEHDEELT